MEKYLVTRFRVCPRHQIFPHCAYRSILHSVIGHESKMRKNAFSLSKYSVIGGLELDVWPVGSILGHIEQVLSIEAFQNRHRHSKLDIY